MVSNIDSSMWEGEFKLRNDKGRPYAVLAEGCTVSWNQGQLYNSSGNNFPRKTGPGTNFNAENSLNHKFIFPSGIFEVEKEYDSKYVYIPIDFARELTKQIRELPLLKSDSGSMLIQKRFKKTLLKFWKRIHSSEPV